MHRNGPIALWLHGMFEYFAAIACFSAPFLFDFGNDATSVSIGMGVAILIAVLTTDGPTSFVARIPIRVHVVLDYLVATALIAAPFALRFTEDDAATRFFVALGVAHLLITLGTRFYGVPHKHGVSPLAASTSIDVEAGGHTVLDD